MLAEAASAGADEAVAAADATTDAAPLPLLLATAAPAPLSLTATPPETALLPEAASADCDWEAEGGATLFTGGETAPPLPAGG